MELSLRHSGRAGAVGKASRDAALQSFKGLLPRNAALPALRSGRRFVSLDRYALKDGYVARGGGCKFAILSSNEADWSELCFKVRTDYLYRLRFRFRLAMEGFAP